MDFSRRFPNVHYNQTWSMLYIVYMVPLQGRKVLCVTRNATAAGVQDRTSVSPVVTTVSERRVWIAVCAPRTTTHHQTAINVDNATGDAKMDAMDRCVFPFESQLKKQWKIGLIFILRTVVRFFQSFFSEVFERAPFWFRTYYYNRFHKIGGKN